MASNPMINILLALIGVAFSILLVLVVVFIIISMKAKQREEDRERSAQYGKKSKSKIQALYNMQSIFDFIEFDKIEDNMIVQKKGKKFIMLIKCNGINFDLMSGVEKNSVEQGFIQYLNTLREPIQIYVQTRTVDLTGSINEYKTKVDSLSSNLANKEYEYNQKLRSGDYDKKELEKERFELVKARNLYEYGMDVVDNTEKMNLNRNILRKQYYIVMSYYPEEANEKIYSDDEVRNIAFSELYTKCQSTISLLSVCGINGRILDSVEIAEVLYAAYNRDEAEIYDLNTALNSGFDNMYVTAQDVLDKRMRELDKQIEIDAIEKANQAVYKVRREQEKERQVKQRELEYKERVTRLATAILEENKILLGDDTAKRAKEEIEKENNAKKKEEDSNEQKKVKGVRKPGRPRKTTRSQN